MIREEEYAANINVGTFSSREEAQSFLSYLRQKYGLSEHDSYINGASVIVTIEKSNTDDSYFYDLVNAIKQERNNHNAYKQVNENMKKNIVKINEKTLRQIVAESVKKMLKEWNGWHQTLTREQAIRELRNAWSYYCQTGEANLTSDDERFVEGLISELSPAMHDKMTHEPEIEMMPDEFSGPKRIVR